MRFARRLKRVFLMAGLCVGWVGCLLADEFTMPLKVGNKWIYTDKTVTVMRDRDDGWHGFTTCSIADLFPDQDTWDDDRVWEEPISNWITVASVTGGSSVLVKSRIQDTEAKMLDTSGSKGKIWTTEIPEIGAVQFDVDTQTVVVPAGTFSDCWRVEILGGISRTLEGTSWTIQGATWWANGIGIVKDSVCVTISGCDPEISVSKLVRYEFK